MKREVTQILDRLAAGDPLAAEDLLPVVYDELRGMASRRMAGEAPGQTLQPTALVHEAWLKIAGVREARFNDRAHFFAAASEAMRRILVDIARRKKRLKRGADPEVEPLDESRIEIGAPPDEILAVHEALDRLATEDPVAVQVVKLRYFVGLPLPNVAEILDLSPRTASRLWSFARVRLRQLLDEG